jgi:hypothetical protein
MPERKKEDELLVDEGEIAEEEFPAGEEGAGEEVALEEETGEAEIPEEGLEEEPEAGKQKINVSFTEVPQIEDLNPGDEIDLITTFRVARKGDGEADIEPVEFIPAEEMEGIEEEAPPTPPAPAGAGGAAPGGGLAGLV